MSLPDTIACPVCGRAIAEDETVCRFCVTQARAATQGIRTAPVAVPPPPRQKFNPTSPSASPERQPFTSTDYHQAEELLADGRPPGLVERMLEEKGLDRQAARSMVKEILERRSRATRDSRTNRWVVFLERSCEISGGLLFLAGVVLLVGHLSGSFRLISAGGWNLLLTLAALLAGGGILAAGNLCRTMWRRVPDLPPDNSASQ